ncbi:MAG TPA: cbb3-type cytochrome c oxidase subunit I [Candidatus Subteraquimicrobiales bacterium]
MSPSAKGFVRASLAYMIIGVLMGFLFTIGPIKNWISLGPGRMLVGVHAHANLVGFVSMMIFGVGYHILPRFSGQPLFSERLAIIHLWLANIGILGMGLFSALAALRGGLLFQAKTSSQVIEGVIAPFMILVSVFAAILAFSFFLFVYNILRTIK